MSLHELVGISLLSAAVFWFARWILLRMRDFFDFALDEQDSAQSLRLALLGCLGLIGAFPVLIVSGLFFLLSTTAILSGGWTTP